MGETNGLSNAGLSPKERLERIEAKLDKIFEKLDTTVPLKDFVELKNQVEKMKLRLAYWAGAGGVIISAVNLVILAVIWRLHLK